MVVRVYSVLYIDLLIDCVRVIRICLYILKINVCLYSTKNVSVEPLNRKYFHLVVAILVDNIPWTF